MSASVEQSHLAYIAFTKTEKGWLWSEWRLHADHVEQYDFFKAQVSAIKCLDFVYLNFSRPGIQVTSSLSSLTPSFQGSLYSQLAKELAARHTR